LSPESQFEFVPISGYTDQFCNIPEALLMAALLRDRSDDIGRRKRNILVAIFGNSTMAIDWCHTRPGDTANRLFCRAKSSYRNGIGLGSTVLDLNTADAVAFQNLQTAIDGAMRVDGPYKRNVQLIKPLIKRGLKTPAEYKDMHAPGRQHILTGTIQTNGFEIRPLAYKLTQRKFYKSEKFKSGLPLTVQAGYLTKRLSTLAEIQTAFEDKPVTVAAIDPGVVKTAQVCIIAETADRTGSSITRISVPRTAQATATKLYLKELHRLKNAQQIGREENTITPLTVPAGTPFTWTSGRIALVAHIKSSLAVYRTFRDFYASKKMKAMTWDRKRASKAELSRAVSSIVEAVQIEPNNAPLIVMGNGKFNIKSGVVYTDKFSRALYTAVRQGAATYRHYSMDHG